MIQGNFDILKIACISIDSAWVIFKYEMYKISNTV